MSEMVERFWRKVERRGPEDCWPWTAMTSANRSGLRYGYFRLAEKMRRAHRVAFEITHGAIPPGLLVRHRCDNPLCVNPAHLDLGTQADNVRDRYDRGRAVHLRGEAHQNSRLSEADVLSIREALEGGEPQRSIAKRFGISQFGVRHARDGWRHV